MCMCDSRTGNACCCASDLLVHCGLPSLLFGPVAKRRRGVDLRQDTRRLRYQIRSGLRSCSLCSSRVEILCSLRFLVLSGSDCSLVSAPEYEKSQANSLSFLNWCDREELSCVVVQRETTEKRQRKLRGYVLTVEKATLSYQIRWVVNGCRKTNIQSSMMF